MSSPPPPPRKPRPEPNLEPKPAVSTGPVAPPPRRGAPVASTGESPTASVSGPAPAATARRSEPTPEPGRGRTMLLAGCAILSVIIIAGVAFLLLRSDSTTKSGPALRASTSVDLQPGELTVAAVGAPFEFPADVRDLVLSTLGAYVDDGVVNPLRKGTADEAALATVFDPGALARLAGTDRALVLDEGLPKAAGKISVTTPPVAMTALAADDGKVVLVSTTIALAVEAQTKQGRLEILRSGSLVFAVDDAGAWKITGWTLGTERGGTAVQSTTTTLAPAP